MNLTRGLVLMTILTTFLAACGTVAEVRPTFEPTNTGLPRAANVSATEVQTTEPSDEAGETAVQATAVPPTATPLPPSATATPLPATTVAPTAPPPTEAPTEAPAETSTEVIYNGLVGDAEFGETWFRGAAAVTFNNAEWQCITCHNPDEPVPGSGPYLFGIGNAAKDHAPAGVSVIDYLAESILNPGVVIAPAQVGEDGTEYVWADGVMPNNWNTVLDDQAIADLVAYLLTLTQEGGHTDHAH